MELSAYNYNLIEIQNKLSTLIPLLYEALFRMHEKQNMKNSKKILFVT